MKRIHLLTFTCKKKRIYGKLEKKLLVRENFMSKKLIALDLDGTTLNSASLISARTVQVLQKA